MYSSDDLATWDYHGLALHPITGHPYISPENIIQRPKAVYSEELEKYKVSPLSSSVPLTRAVIQTTHTVILSPSFNSPRYCKYLLHLLSVHIYHLHRHPPLIYSPLLSTRPAIALPCGVYLHCYFKPLFYLLPPSVPFLSLTLLF